MSNLKEYHVTCDRYIRDRGYAYFRVEAESEEKALAIVQEDPSSYEYKEVMHKANGGDEDFRITKDPQ